MDGIVRIARDIRICIYGEGERERCRCWNLIGWDVERGRVWEN